MTHRFIETLVRAGCEVRFEPPDTVKIKRVSPIPRERFQALVEEAKQRKPDIVAALRAREFDRLYALVKGSVQRVAEVVPEGGLEAARRTGVLPRLNALMCKIDEASKALDEPALLGALEAWEKGWQEVAHAMARQRSTAAPAPVEASA